MATVKQVKRIKAAAGRTTEASERPARAVQVGDTGVVDLAARVITSTVTLKGVEATLNQHKDDLEAALLPKLVQIGRQAEAPTSFDIETPAGELRVTFADRYQAIKLERLPAILDVVGSRNQALFEVGAAIKVRAPETQAAQERLIKKLKRKLGKRLFEEAFQVAFCVRPSSTFTAHRYSLLTDRQNARLADDVKQVVSHKVLE